MYILSSIQLFDKMKQISIIWSPICHTMCFQIEIIFGWGISKRHRRPKCMNIVHLVPHNILKSLDIKQVTYKGQIIIIHEFVCP